MYIHRFDEKAPEHEQAPDELIELFQCQMYGISPSELGEQDPRIVAIHYTLWNEFKRLQELIQRKDQQKNKGKTLGG